MVDSTKTLTILGIIQPLFFKERINLLEYLNANKVGIGQSCGGNGTCTTCRVFILKGAENLNVRTELEVERATERNFSDHERLACQTEVFGSIEIEIPQE